MMLALLLLFLCSLICVLWKWKDGTHIKLNLVRYYYNYITYYSLVSLSSLLILPVCFARPKNVFNSNVGTAIVRYLSRLLIKDIEFELRDGEILAEDRGAVIVSNHQSSFDILGLFVKWNIGNKIAIVAKKQLLYVWPFGLTAYLCGGVFIDRSHVKNSYAQLDHTTKMMKNKIKIWMFPEGTRNNNGRKFLPFKKGAFNIAVKAQVPIIPIVFSPYYFIDTKKRIFKKGRIIMQCLEPVPTADLTMDDVPALSDKLRGIMIEAYDKLNKEVLNGLPSNYHNKC